MEVAKKMEEYWDPFRFHQEKELLDRLETLLHSDLLDPIFERCHYPEERDYWKSLYEGQSFRLTSSLAPKYHKMCEQVKETLRFDEPVEFFITSDPQINAVSYLRQSESHSHIIALNSGLVENFSDMEFRFVVGHELGHIIYQAAQLRRLIHNIFPQPQSIPLAIHNLIRLWDKFAEISADRMGFVAAPDLKSCVTAFFKLSSGLSMSKISFEFESYLEEVETTLDNFSPHKNLFYSSHPANPIRIKAIQLFSESKSYNEYVDSKEFVTDPEMEKKMDELSLLMELHPDNERDHYRLLVMASGGMLMAGVDDEVAKEEEEEILHFLSQFTIYPRNFLENILANFEEDDHMKDFFMDAVTNLLALDPGERYSVFHFLSKVALADRVIKEEEIEFLMSFATQTLGMHEIEASREFVASLHENQFLPRI